METGNNALGEDWGLMAEYFLHRVNLQFDDKEKVGG